MNNLLLITGAGASYDVINEDIISSEATGTSSYRPPLTRNLFYPSLSDSGEVGSPNEEGGYVLTCLKEHPLAAQAGYEFHNRFGKNNEEANLELFLSELKNNRKFIIKKQFWAMPLYLYELFNKISDNYLPTPYGLPSNYKSLIDKISQSNYNQIIWLNLNYDLLADYAIKISTNNELKAFHDYMELETQDGLKIMYTKPHGSVNWFKKINDANIEWINIKLGHLPTGFESRLSTEIYTSNLAQIRHAEDHAKGFHSIKFPEGWYPAITAPIGQYDPVYPEHIENIVPELKKTDAIICIGFGALDKDILDLIKLKMPEIKKLQIVNGTREAGDRVHLKIINHCGNVKLNHREAIFEGGFTQFVKEGIQSWLAL
jgi:hypothetical protein